MTLFLTILAVTTIVAIVICVLVITLLVTGVTFWWLNSDIYKRKFEIIRKRRREDEV